MPSRRPLVGLAVLATALLGSARTRAAEGDPKIPVERYRLDNGLEVLLHPDRTVPLVYVSLWYHVASGDETPGKTGFAHLFEHMMFQGSQHVGEDQHFKVLKKVGVSVINGSTNTDRTNYFEQVPSHQIETALWLESDRMGYMLPLLTAASLDNQREVVRNERRQNYDNVPYGKDRFVTNQLLYAEGHPYRYLTIGRHEDLARASLEDVKNFFRTWYVPSNATLMIAGDIEIPQAKKLVDKWFGTFPKTTRPVHHEVPPTPVTAPKREVVTDDFAKLRRIHYAWHSPKAFAPGEAEMDIVSSVLGRPGTGRLYKILVHDKQWAQSVGVFQQGQGFSGIFHVTADLKPDADVAAVEAVLDQEIERVTKEPISERERKRVITEAEAGLVRGLEPLAARGESLQRFNHFLGEPDSFTRVLDNFRNATPDGIRATAARFLGKQNRIEVVTMPAGTPAKPVSLNSHGDAGGSAAGVPSRGVWDPSRVPVQTKGGK
jgi:predicted Zn-dependent peptidase